MSYQIELNWKRNPEGCLFALSGDHVVGIVMGIKKANATEERWAYSLNNTEFKSSKGSLSGETTSEEEAKNCLQKVWVEHIRLGLDN